MAQKADVQEQMRQNAARLYGGAGEVATKYAELLLGSTDAGDPMLAHEIKEHARQMLEANQGGDFDEGAKQMSWILFKIGKRVAGEISERVAIATTVFDIGDGYTELLPEVAKTQKAFVVDYRLKRRLGEINEQLARIDAPPTPPQSRQRTPSRPEGRKQQKTKSDPPHPGENEPDPESTLDALTEAVRLLDFLDKGERSFSTEQDKREFYAKYPRLKNVPGAATHSPDPGERSRIDTQLNRTAEDEDNCRLACSEGAKFCATAAWHRCTRAASDARMRCLPLLGADSSSDDSFVRCTQAADAIARSCAALARPCRR